MLVLTPIAASVVAACNSYGSSSTTTTAVDAGACNGVGGTSTTEDQHSHSVCVPTADLTSPPASGATYTSTNDANHTHTLTLTSAQLASIEAGQSITVASSSAIDPINNDPHTHSWTLRKA